MKVIQRAKWRYQRVRHARRQIRCSFKVFRHTRATRRALAAMVLRMVDQSLRYPLNAQRARRDEFKVVIDGWPDAVQVIVGVHGLSVMVVQQADFWDFLLWPDCMPWRKHGQWRCFDPGCLASGPYRRLEDLLFEHLAVPFLAFLADVPEQAQLVLCSIEGIQHACVEELQAVNRLERPAQRVICWHLPPGANLL
ncbi:hypothetical protein [Limnohabitans sp.]|uniref:hypothetical protein n=1 Tax=Limnohabitans sp. TaxID=1907725 RepID=UPI0025B91136|nr:hypothetical protein [Limnohabitans sp.]